MSRQTAILIMATTAALITVTTTAAHADHVHYIWIETAEGNFITYTDIAANEATHTRITTNTINGDKVYEQREFCGEENEREYIRQQNPDNLGACVYTHINPYSGDVSGSTIVLSQVDNCKERSDAESAQHIEYLTPDEYIRERTENLHEHTCGYWYANTVKNEYAYTIIDLPRDRGTPPNYEQLVAAGVKAGLDSWGDINNITFTHTNSRLEADIVIQQQIGDGTQYANAHIGCLFDNDQCTIQLFTDVNVRDKQTLVNTHSIEFTVAHEFGHLIGLPHHIEPDHIMNSVHAREVREYWEARNINVPRMTEPTFEQRLLENENDYLDYADDIDADEIPTDIDGIMRHEKTTEFLEFIQIVLLNTPEDDRLQMWWDIAENAFQALRNTIHP